jgi:hypothetical protein
MSRAAARAVAGIGPGDHACCVFGPDDEQQALVGRFARGAIGRGERLFDLTDRSDEATIRSYLDDAGVDAARCLSLRRLQIRHSAEMGLAGGFDGERLLATCEAVARAAVDDGFSGVAAPLAMTRVLDLCGFAGAGRLEVVRRSAGDQQRT